MTELCNTPISIKMTTEQLVEKICRLPEGALFTNYNRYDTMYVVSIINSFRAQYLRDMFLKTGRLNPVCYQKHWPRYDRELRGDGFGKFTAPQVISLGSSDGIRYCGTIWGSQSFIRVKSRSELSDMNNHEVMRVSNNRNTYFLFDGNSSMIELYGKEYTSRKVLMEILAANPLDVPTFNVKMDQYPLDEDAIPQVEQMIFSANTRISEATAPSQPFTSNMLPKK
jgi:hypothetical protein